MNLIKNQAEQKISRRDLLSEDHRPWLNEDGSLKSDDEIRKVCHSWPPTVWGRYFKWTNGNVKDKNLAYSPDMDTDEMAERPQLSELISNESADPELKQALEVALEHLSRRERLIIKKFFLEKQTTKQIAKKLKIVPSTVRVLRKRGVDKLKKLVRTKDFWEELEERKIELKQELKPKM